jgi:hypothetical protein
MNAAANKLRAERAYRIRVASPGEWQEFSNLWMAFNAIYGGEPDRRERARVISCIRRSFSERSALTVLRAVTTPIDQILLIPPGNLLHNRYDSSFRSASVRYAALYRNRKETSISRLAAVAAVLYQVRCNLIHGGKDPHNERDKMLVRESLKVLHVLVPALENQLRVAQ